MSVETEFYISGLTCDGCVKTAKGALSSITGFEDAEIDLRQGTMKVKGDVDPQAIAEAMASVGYGAVVKSA